MGLETPVCVSMVEARAGVEGQGGANSRPLLLGGRRGHPCRGDGKGGSHRWGRGERQHGSSNPTRLFVGRVEMDVQWIRGAWSKVGAGEANAMVRRIVHWQCIVDRSDATSVHHEREFCAAGRVGDPSASSLINPSVHHIVVLLFG